MLISAFITLTAFVLFAAGIRSLLLLRRLPLPKESRHADPLFSTINLMFSTGERTPEFSVRQRRTIWLFCGSMLLLYVARVVYMQCAELPT